MLRFAFGMNSSGVDITGGEPPPRKLIIKASLYLLNTLFPDVLRSPEYCLL
jgi:hypothetical protein